IKEWPTDERPRERLTKLGPAALASRELLAILIETGTPATAARPARSAIDLAGDLLKHFEGESGGGLRRIGAASLTELCRGPGIGGAKATRIAAALELGRRGTREARPERERIRNAEGVDEQVAVRRGDLLLDGFHVLLLSTQNRVLRRLQVPGGPLAASVVHRREVFRTAVTECAASAIVVHKHPSGGPPPSAEDRAVTR